jgi:hypothetical protein
MAIAPSYTRTESLDPRVAAEAEKGVWPRFFMDTVPDELESRKQGRRCFKEEERVEVFMPGNNLNIPVFRVTDEHRERWPKQYDAFKKGLEPPTDGTPIEEWPALNRAQILELRYLNFRTVEDIANATDHALQRMGMGARNLRDRAKAFMDDAAAIALVEKTSAESAAKDTEIENLRLMVQQQAEALQNLQTQFTRLADAKSPLETHVPGHHDPVELMKQTSSTSQGQPAGDGSALASVAPSRRAQARAKAAQSA